MPAAARKEDQEPERSSVADALELRLELSEALAIATPADDDHIIRRLRPIGEKVGNCMKPTLAAGGTTGTNVVHESLEAEKRDGTEDGGNYKQYPAENEE